MMSTTETPPRISTFARQCLISFKECLEGTSALDTNRYSSIEDQMARFSIWSANMAVFSSGKACMDHHVREVPEVQRLILGILEILQGRLQECTLIIKRITGFSIEKQFATLAQGDFERITEAISSQVSLLHELSDTIRKASRESQDVKLSATFQIKDDDGNDSEDISKDYFANNIRDRFPDSSDVISDRLATTMVLRRKRILHRRSRHTINPTKLAVPISKPLIRLQLMAQLQNIQEKLPQNQSIEPIAVPSTTNSTPQNLQQAASPSFSYANLIELDSQGDLAFPSRPNQNTFLPACPYCFHVLSNEEMNSEEGWRRHVLDDLDALVCLFDPCDEPEVLYRHNNDWLQHMRKHTQYWRCPAKAHKSHDFRTREDFENHMRQDHKRNYTAAQLSLLAEKSMRSSRSLFESCPLCGGKDSTEDDKTSGGLIDHIANHLNSIALKSLPSDHGDVDEDSSIGLKNYARSRSTLRSVLDDENASPKLTGDSRSQSTQNSSSIEDALNQDYSVSPYVGKRIWSELVWNGGDWEGTGKQSRFPGFVPFAYAKDLPDLAQDDILSVENLPNRARNDITFATDLRANDANKVYDNIAAQNIIPTLEGFRQHILTLNPKLSEANGYLLDRMASQMQRSLEALRTTRLEHIASVNAGTCVSGLRCMAKSTGGTSYLDPEDFPPGIPMPPTVSFPAEFECRFCWRVKKFKRPSDWVKHIYEDVAPFVCNWDQCHELKVFKRRSDWVRHENERHRRLHCWTCDIDDCRHTCYRRDSFIKHLTREHQLPEPSQSPNKDSSISQDTLSKVDECHVMSQAKPSDESCRFCGRTFPAWRELTAHLAMHMEQINLPIIKSIGTSDFGTLEMPPVPSLDYQSLTISGESSIPSHGPPYWMSTHGDFTTIDDKAKDFLEDQFWEDFE
ncbi:hypothetical protein M426DRAFT_176005 [Hypoxylon sp. CI-4A]|nr:hypothetical protein M426DRAFT_176005 [Hypoxylon sp. CI-4A]